MRQVWSGNPVLSFTLRSKQSFPVVSFLLLSVFLALVLVVPKFVQLVC